MYFSDLSAFIEMGGHGFYVWIAFGFSIFWIAYLLINPGMKKNKLLKLIYSQQQLERNKK
jgi:heme exporter protein D